VNVKNSTATYQTGVRQYLASVRGVRYGFREEVQIDAGWVRNEQYASDLCKRRFDQGSVSPFVVMITTPAMPDLQRGRIFEMSESVDELIGYPQYPSDGTWVDVQFRAVAIDQHYIRLCNTEVYAVRV
jgi:hypothetical protein